VIPGRWERLNVFRRGRERKPLSLKAVKGKRERKRCCNDGRYEMTVGIRLSGVMVPPGSEWILSVVKCAQLK
jgi:hypothetical protein